MKKVILIISLIFLVGCTSNSMKNNESITEYYLTYNQDKLKVGMNYTNLSLIVGPYNNVRTEESTYQEGLSNIYEYDDFEVETYKENNVEKIYAINITNEKIVTNEGIHLYSTKQDMFDCYGNNYYSPYDNVYIYNLNNSNISFIVENDIIINIRYYLG